MANDLKNAGFLDGLTNWSASGPASLAVDEATRGAPGRAVMVATPNGSGTFAISTPAADRVAVSQGQTIEVSGFYWGPGGSESFTVGIYDVTGTLRSRITPPVTSAADDGGARRGVPWSFNRVYSRFAAPAGGLAGVDLYGYTNLGSTSLALLKPFMDVAPTVPGPQRFDPGQHVNPDLQLPVWPSILPAFQSETLQATPSPLRKEYMADSSVPITRIMARSPIVKFQGAMKLNLEQRDALQAFFLAGAASPESDAQFWFLRPDTQELCFARWSADGDPTDGGLSPGARSTKIGLTLTVA